MFFGDFLCYVVPLIENIYHHWNEATENENENSSKTSRYAQDKQRKKSE